MRTARTDDGTTIAYAVDGEADETVVFLPDAGFGPWLWGWQAPAFAGPYRTVVVATRGTDGSETAGPYGVDRLAADLEAVLADASVSRAHLVGAGLGGMVALRYAHEYGRARTFVLVGAAASGDAVDPDVLETLYPDPADRGRLREALSVAFSGSYRAEADVERILEWRRSEDASGEALRGHLAALRSFDSGPLYERTEPALVCHGVDDPVISLEAGRELADALPRGQFEPVEGRRLCFLEHSAAVTDAIVGFLESQ